MSGDHFIGHQPYDIKWSVDGKFIYYSKDNDSTRYPHLYQYEVKSKTTKLIPIDEVENLLFYSSEINGLNNIYTLQNNHLLLFNKQNGHTTPIIETNDVKEELQHVKNAERVYFRQDNNLYGYDKSTGRLFQVTNFVMKEKSAPSTNDSDDLYKRQQLALFDYYKDEEKLKELPTKEDKSIYIGDKVLQSIQISPNEKFIMYRTSNQTGNSSTKVPHYVTKDGYLEVEDARPKVGSTDLDDIQLNIYHLEKDTNYQLDFSQLTNIRTRPAYQSEYGLEGDLEKDKILYIHEVDFSKSGDFVLISLKSQDNKDRWLMIYDFNSEKLTEIEHQHDEAWIGGPGISGWNMQKGNMGWLNNDDHIYFQSEESGYSHLYLYDRKNNSTQALTSGAFEVHGVELSQTGKHFFITANKTHPGNRDYYKLEIATKKLTPLLTNDGYHDVTLSPDEKWMAVRYSFKNKPWEVYLAPVKENAEMKQITTSTNTSFNNINWIQPEVITFKAEDGKEIYARLYTPENENSNKAAVIFVHGAGYLQNAHNWWSSYHREYMFHNLLVEQGYTVLDIDYRASEGYGRNHRTEIYRNMGGLDLSDNLDGRSYLINNQNIDSDKIGIYGGSYGGFITLMALLQHPGDFACGGALRAVTDWSHYNHEYTSNILNTPETDSIAYHRSSPINYADGLSDPLIMFHGMIDDNVQYQDVIRLNQRFIELGKTNWNLVSYPLEKHGFKTTSSWTDEYSRLLQMFNKELLNK